MRAKTLSIPAILALTYVTWIVVGAGLLLLPWSTPEAGMTLSDALFTSTSAVTVTGLIVLDTASELTRFGQGVLMLLIQLGGMGLMTFAVLVLSTLGRSVGLTHRRFLREEMGLESFGGLVELVWIIFRIVLIVELLGMAILAFAFVPELGWVDGLWHAAFHSVSAFNNAGFSTFPDSLTSWVQSPLVIFTISLQFMVGGLGFAVWADLFSKSSVSKLSLHTKIMLWGTLGLVAIGFGSYAVLEWTNPATLGGLDGMGAKLQAAWFEGVTPRTAGFNSLDTAGMRDATTLSTMALMVVGGGPTSTAGGIKVSTAVVLLLATIAFFRHSGRMNAFGYSIGPSAGVKVMALLCISIFIILIGMFILVATQSAGFLDIMFEVTSAFGTVGLSRGLTGELDDLGRAVIIVIMFLGRVGPLTLGIFMASKVPPRVKLPEGEVFLG